MQSGISPGGVRGGAPYGAVGSAQALRPEIAGLLPGTFSRQGAVGPSGAVHRAIGEWRLSGGAGAAEARMVLRDEFGLVTAVDLLVMLAVPGWPRAKMPAPALIRGAARSGRQPTQRRQVNSPDAVIAGAHCAGMVPHLTQPATAARISGIPVKTGISGFGTARDPRFHGDAAGSRDRRRCQDRQQSGAAVRCRAPPIRRTLP